MSVGTFCWAMNESLDLCTSLSFFLFSNQLPTFLLTLLFAAPLGDSSTTFLSSPPNHQFSHSTLLGAASSATLTSSSLVAYLPVVGVWQPAAAIQPAVFIPHHATAAPCSYLLYNQPAVAVAASPLVGATTTTATTTTVPPSHVIHTEASAAAANAPIRFYYKTTDSKFDTGTASGTEHLMTRSAEALYRSDSGGRRKYDKNGHRLASDSSRLLDSINNADMAARQLNKLSRNMASSVYSHLNAGTEF